MSENSVGGRARSRPKPSFSLTRRRTRLVAAVGAAALAFAIPAAAAQATTHGATGTTGAAPSATGSGHQPTSYPNPYHKFSDAALKVGHGATPADRARIMGQLTDPPFIVPAYDVQPLWKKGITGKGTSIATIVSFGDPNIQAVIDAYDERYGLPKANVTILTPLGDVSCPSGQEATCAGWKGETDLDIEMYHTLAPGAHLYVVATPVAETLGIHGFPQMMKAIDYLLEAQDRPGHLDEPGRDREDLQAPPTRSEPRPDVRAREGGRCADRHLHRRLRRDRSEAQGWGLRRTESPSGRHPIRWSPQRAAPSSTGSMASAAHPTR